MVARNRLGSTHSLRYAGLAALLLVGCGSSGQLETIELNLAALSQQVSELEQAAATIEQLEGVESRVVANAEATHDGQTEIIEKLDGLSRTLAVLESQIEASTRRIDQLSLQLQATQEQLRAHASQPAVLTGEGGQPPIDATDPEALYQSAYANYQRGNFELALLAFEEYQEAFPDTELADNALYWTGETYFSQRRFSSAISTFDDLLTRFPASEKAASARFRQGFAYIERGDNDEGIKKLRELVAEYPSSAEAELARGQLQRLAPP